MVLDMARPKNKLSTIWPGTRRRDAVKKVDSQGQHFTGIHDRFFRDPVSRESQLEIGWTEQKCKEWDELAKRRSYVSSHSKGIQKIPRTMVSYPEQGSQKWAYETSIWFWSRCLDEKSFTRFRRTSWRASPWRSTKTMAFIFKHIVVGKVWKESEVSSKGFFVTFLLQLVLFTTDSDPL